jgi:hypothetical protein
MGCQCAKPPANGNMNLETAPPKSEELICEKSESKIEKVEKIEKEEKEEKVPEKVEDTVTELLNINITLEIK